MPTYSFEGLDRRGKKVKGVREFYSQRALVAELLKEGIFVSKIEEVKPKKSFLQLFGKFHFGVKKDLPDFFFQLSLLLKSGMPIVPSLRIIAESAGKISFKKVLLDIASTISEGKKFSEALSKYKDIFGDMYINVIRSAEVSGRLSDVLMDISVYEESKKRTFDTLKSATIYPFTVIAIGLGVVGFLVSYVVPKIEKIFASLGRDIPLSTKLLVQTGMTLKNYGFYTFLAVLLLAFILRIFYVKNQNFRKKVDLYLYKSKFIKALIISRFSNILSFQLKEGIPLTAALDLSAKTIWNSVFKEKVYGIIEDIKSGKKFSESVKNSGIFPELFIAAVTTGENSGNLPEVLGRVSEFYKKTVEKISVNFISIIEPLFIVLIGLIVGFIALSIMGPLFEINTLVRPM